MNQIATTLNEQSGLKLQKTTIVKLNMGKVGQLIRNMQTVTVTVDTSASTLPQCETTSATSMIV